MLKLSMEAENIDFVFQRDSDDSSKTTCPSLNQEDAIQLLRDHGETQKWCYNNLSSTILNLIEKYDETNTRFQNISILDILAGIKFDSTGQDSGNNVISEVTQKREHVKHSINNIDTHLGYISTDIDTNLLTADTPHLHLKSGNNEISNALFENGLMHGSVWKDPTVRYNNPFDPRLTFDGLHCFQKPKSWNCKLENSSKECPETFNTFLDILNPSGFANKYFETYRQYLDDLRNSSKRQTRGDTMDQKRESYLVENPDTHNVPSFVDNEYENIELWSRITATQKFWRENEHSRSPDDKSSQSLLCAVFSRSHEDGDNEEGHSSKSTTCLHPLETDVSSRQPASSTEPFLAQPTSKMVKHDTESLETLPASVHLPMCDQNNVFSETNTKRESKTYPAQQTGTSANSQHDGHLENNRKPAICLVNDPLKPVSDQARINEHEDLQRKDAGDLSTKKEGIAGMGPHPKNAPAEPKPVKNSTSSEGNTRHQAQTSMFWSNHQQNNNDIKQQQQQQQQQQQREKQLQQQQSPKQQQQQQKKQEQQQKHQQQKQQQQQNQLQQRQQQQQPEQQKQVQSHQQQTQMQLQQQQKQLQHQQQQQHKRENQQQKRQQQQKLQQQKPNQQKHQQQQLMQQQQLQQQKPQQQQQKQQQQKQQQQNVQQQQKQKTQQQQQLQMQQKQKQQQQQQECQQQLSQQKHNQAHLQKLQLQEQKRQMLPQETQKLGGREQQQPLHEKQNLQADNKQQQRKYQQPQQQQKRSHQQPVLHQQKQHFHQQDDMLYSQVYSGTYIQPHYHLCQGQWSGSNPEYEQSYGQDQSRDFDFDQQNLQYDHAQDFANQQTTQYITQNTSQPVYPIHVYYPNLQPLYVQPTFVSNSQSSFDPNITEQSAYQPTCAWQTQQGVDYSSQQSGYTNTYGNGYQPSVNDGAHFLNLNFVQQDRSQQSDLKLDDEVWYINGMPHRHAKTTQQNVDVQACYNIAFIPQNFNWNADPNQPNNAPSNYTHSTGSAVSPTRTKKGQQHSNTLEMQTEPINLNNNNVVHHCSDEAVDRSSVSEVPLVLNSDEISNASLCSIVSSISEISGEFFLGNTDMLDDTSETWCGDGDVEAVHNKNLFDETFGAFETDVSYSEIKQFDSGGYVDFNNCAPDYEDLYKVGRRIKVLSGRKHANRDRIKSQRHNSRTLRRANLINII